jgi:hypothetical protein
LVRNQIGWTYHQLSLPYILLQLLLLLVLLLLLLLIMEDW